MGQLRLTTTAILHSIPPGCRGPRCYAVLRADAAEGTAAVYRLAPLFISSLAFFAAAASVALFCDTDDD